VGFGFQPNAGAVLPVAYWSVLVADDGEASDEETHL
jgi:hypothetical protein